MTSPQWRRSPISARTSPAATRAGGSTPGRERWAGLGVDIAVVYGHLDTARSVRPVSRDRSDLGNFTTGERSDFDIIDRFLANVDDDRQTRGRPTPRHVRIRWGRAASSLPAISSTTTVGGHRRRAPDGCRRSWVQRERAGAPTTSSWAGPTPHSPVAVCRHHRRLGDRPAARRGVYDQALVMVVADHGITIGPGVDNQRLITEARSHHRRSPDVRQVPERAGWRGARDRRRRGGRDRRRPVRIADVTRTVVPWAMDGTSLLDPDRPSEPSR